jgi:DNA-binding beta-propeller fold protein YncE
LATIGKLGPGADGLRRPRGIALDVQDNLYIADTANHRIQRFSAQGEPLGPWGTIGSAPGEFILPSSLAFDSLGQLYVADTGNHRVQKLAPDGAFVSEWAGVHFPHGLAVDADDAVYVSDEAGLRKFTQRGDLLAEWISPGRFGDPYGLAIDGAGSIWVADTDNGRILALAPTGEVLLALGSEGNEVGRFKYPEAVAVDARGRVYVADRGNDRLQLWQP